MASVPVATRAEALGSLKGEINKSECIKCSDGRHDEKTVCSGARGVAEMAKVAGVSGPAPVVVEAAKKAVGCASERCVAEKLRLSTENFKPEGPRNTTALISDENIDDSTKLWGIEFPEFMPLEFCLLDFDNYGGSLTKHPVTEIIKSGKKCAACVVNTDVSTHMPCGIHWFAMFIDARKPEVTIEHFNSSGRPPREEILKYMYREKAAVEAALKRPVKLIFGADIRHQMSKTECGVYSLYFIRRRLEGVSYDFFKRHRIDDADIIEFRKYLFSGEK